jgi:DNA-binding transcriptional MerR regulator
MADTNIDRVIAAFTEDQVERLTGVTAAQLRYWDRTKFYVPAYADDDRRTPYSRIYSFKDIVALRTLNVLRNEHDVTLQHLRKVAKKLSHLAGDVWTGTTLYVLNRKVIFHEPGTAKPREVLSGQYILGVPLKRIVSDTKRELKKLRHRSLDSIGQVARSRFVNNNAWVVAGTRIATAAVRRFSEAGYTVDQIITEYPDLTPDDVEAALAHEKKLSDAA